MKKTCFCFLVFSFVFAFSVNAQNAPANKPVVERKDNQASLSRKASSDTPNPIDEDDEYMGRKEEFLHHLTVSELPADFPKYDKSYSLSEYNNIVDSYYITHATIITEKTRQKLANRINK